MGDRPPFDTQKRPNGGLPIISLSSMENQIDNDHYIDALCKLGGNGGQDESILYECQVFSFLNQTLIC